jgi:hypothetical protein
MVRSACVVVVVVVVVASYRHLAQFFNYMEIKSRRGPRPRRPLP